MKRALAALLVMSAAAVASASCGPEARPRARTAPVIQPRLDARAVVLEVRGRDAFADRPETVRALRDALVEDLEAIGFDVFDGDHPERASAALEMSLEVRTTFASPALGAAPETHTLRLDGTVTRRADGAARTIADEAMEVTETGSAEAALRASLDRLSRASIAPITVAAVGLEPGESVDLAARLAGRRVEVMTKREEAAAALIAAEASETIGGTLVTRPLGDSYYVGGLDDGDIFYERVSRVDVATVDGPPVVRRQCSRLSLVADGRARVVFERRFFDSFPQLGGDGHSLVVAVSSASAEPDQELRTRTLVRVDTTSGDVSELSSFADVRGLAPSVPPRGAFMLVRVTDPDRTVSLWGVPLAGGTPVRVALPEGAPGSPEWDDDGRHAWVAVGEGKRHSIVRVDAQTGTATAVAGRLVDEDWGTRMSYALPLPDGALLVSEHDDEVDGHWLSRHDPTTGEHTRLVEIEIAARIERTLDSRWVAIDVQSYRSPGDPTSHDIEIVLVDTATGAVRAITRNAEDDRLSAFSADETAIYLRLSSKDPDAALPTSRVYRYPVAP